MLYQTQASTEPHAVASTNDANCWKSAGSSDKAEMFHQVAFASQDLMVLISHHHCQLVLKQQSTAISKLTQDCPHRKVFMYSRGH